MRVLRGQPTVGIEFFDVLCADQEFCAELGRAVLAAGRLESALIRSLESHAPHEKTAKATLGRLISLAETHGLVPSMLGALRLLKDQRNYLTHQIHALLSGLVRETILECSGPLDSDVITYTERAWQLAANLNHIAELIESKHVASAPPSGVL